MKDIPTFKQFVESQLSGYYMGRGSDSREVDKLRQAVDAALNTRRGSPEGTIEKLRNEIGELYKRVEGELKEKLMGMFRSIKDVG
tara:strand:- start:653 stop:907 length:255 start_codon:yes stop_codon:yes gene_type:complete